MEFDRKLIREVKDVLDRCRDGGLMLATVESCTGGLLAAALTAVPGSSAVVERGYVTYSNAAKTDMVGVPEALIRRDGAVSETVARHGRRRARTPARRHRGRHHRDRRPGWRHPRKAGGPRSTSLQHAAIILHCIAACCLVSRGAIIRLLAVRTALVMVIAQIDSGGLVA